MHAFAGMINVTELLQAKERTANTNGTGVDISQAIGTLEARLSGTTNGGTSPTGDVKLQESDDDSTYTDVSSGSFTQIDDTTGEHESINLDSRALKKYLRAVLTVGGTSPQIVCAVELIYVTK